MQKQIGEQWADHAALRRAALPWQPLAIHSLERGSEPPLDIQQHPAFPDVAADRFHQETMIDLIEGRHHTLPIIRTFPSGSRLLVATIHLKPKR